MTTNKKKTGRSLLFHLSRRLNKLNIQGQKTACKKLSITLDLLNIINPCVDTHLLLAKSLYHIQNDDFKDLKMTVATASKSAV